MRSNLVLTAAHQSLASFYRYAGKSVVSDESSACDLVAVLCQRGAVVFFAVTVRCQLDCHRIDLQCAIDISNLVIACYIRVSVHDLCCGRHVVGRSGVGLASGHSYAGNLVALLQASGCKLPAVLGQWGAIIGLLIAVRCNRDLDRVLVCNFQCTRLVCNLVVLSLRSLFQGMRGDLVLTAANQGLAAFYRYAGKSVVSNKLSASNLVAVLCQRGAVVFLAGAVRCQLDFNRFYFQCSVDVRYLVVVCYIIAAVHDSCIRRHVCSGSGICLASGHSYAGDCVT